MFSYCHIVGMPLNRQHVLNYNKGRVRVAGLQLGQGRTFTLRPLVQVHQRTNRMALIGSGRV